jgi:hypothetical protein
VSVGLETTLQGRLWGGYSPVRTLWRAHRPRALWKLTSPAGAPTLRFVEQHGLTVLRGPFAGMRYPASAVGRANYLGAKLLGSYEEELAPVVTEFMRRGFRRIVNIGAGEGYYAVGFALHCPDAQVYAFESTRYERKLCQQLAQVNEVDLIVSATLTRERLAEFPIDEATLLFVDIEGGELELLQPEYVPALTRATLLVELHPHASPTLPQIVRRRFDASHDTGLIRSTPREPSTYPERPESILLSEGRTEALWAVFRPRATDGAFN